MSKNTVLGAAALIVIAGIVGAVLLGRIPVESLYGLVPTALAYLTAAPGGGGPKPPRPSVLSVLPALALVASLALPSCGTSPAPLRPLVDVMPDVCRAGYEGCVETAAEQEDVWVRAAIRTGCYLGMTGCELAHAAADGAIPAGAKKIAIPVRDPCDSWTLSECSDRAGVCACDAGRRACAGEPPCGGFRDRCLDGCEAERHARVGLEDGLQ